MGYALSKRLSAVASFVPKGCYLADVGSDHALLPLSLLEKGMISYAECIENKTGPYIRMKANIENSPFQRRVYCSMSDGISDLQNEVDCVSICGVGGRLACEILEKHPDRLENVKTIVLDPHRDLEAVRKRVSALGYHIADETMVFEDKIYYTIIRFEKGELEQPYRPADLLFGPVLRKKRPEEFLEWLTLQRKKINTLLNGALSPAAREKYLILYRLVTKELKKEAKS